MKKNIVIITLVCAFITALCSCSEADDVKFSCDDTIDSWVKDNLDDIRLMDRSDWLQTNAILKPAVARAFSPAQKEAFWREKIQETLKLDWNQEEKKHIQQILHFFDHHADLFAVKKLTTDQEDLVDLFFYQWQQEAQQKLGWTENIGLAIVTTGYPLRDTTGELLIIEDSTTPLMLTQAEETCECKTIVNLCTFSMECRQGNCTETDGGCGFAWMHDCNGICVPK